MVQRKSGEPADVKPPDSAAEPPPQLPTAPATRAQQLEQVTKWLLAGHSAADITEAAAQAWPNAKPAALLLAATDKIAESANYDLDLIVGFTLEGTRDLYRRMLEIGDFSGALKALRQLHDLATAHVRKTPL